jgi:hypothetical protein
MFRDFEYPGEPIVYFQQGLRRAGYTSPNRKTWGYEAQETG